MNMVIAVGVVMLTLARNKPPMEPKPIERVAGQDAHSALPQ